MREQPFCAPVTPSAAARFAVGRLRGRWPGDMGIICRLENVTTAEGKWTFRSADPQVLQSAVIDT